MTSGPPTFSKRRNPSSCVMTGTCSTNAVAAIHRSFTRDWDPLRAAERRTAHWKATFSSIPMGRILKACSRVSKHWACLPMSVALNTAKRSSPNVTTETAKLPGNDEKFNGRFCSRAMKKLVSRIAPTGSSAKAVLPNRVSGESNAFPGFWGHLMMLENIDDLFARERQGPGVVRHWNEHGTGHAPIGEGDPLSCGSAFDHLKELRPGFRQR